jgi:hypothetical protein
MDGETRAFFAKREAKRGKLALDQQAAPEA